MNNEIVFLSTKGPGKNSNGLDVGQQTSDFNDFFNGEVKAQRKTDGSLERYPEQASHEKNENLERAGENAVEEKSEEATNFTLIGRELPKLMLHERGLEVGRIILTPQSSSISNKSLSDFMRNQSGGSPEQPDGESSDAKVQKNNPSGVKEISGLRSSNEVDSTDKKTTKLDPKLLESKALQKELVQKPEKNSQENAKEPSIDRVIQKKQADPEKFSKPRHQATIDTNNPVFDSFQKQLNSRLALVNSTISGQKSTEIGALSKKVAESSGKRPLKHEPTQAREIKAQDSRTSTELNLAIKKNEELKGYLEGGSKKAVDQITNKLVKDTFRKTSEKISIREDLTDPLKGSEKLTISNTKPSILVQEVQQLTAKEIATVSDIKAETRSPFREITTGAQQAHQNQLENVIQKFSEALGSRMINAIQQNNWNLQLKLNPASLGEINVALEFNDGNLEGKLYAADETTRALLQESLSRLKLGLKEGLENYQSVDVFIGERRQNLDDRNKPKNSNNQSLEIDLGEEITSKTQLANLISTGRVDIQV